MFSGLWVRNKNAHPTSSANCCTERWDGGFAVAQVRKCQRLSVASSEETLAGNRMRGVDWVGLFSHGASEQMSGASLTLGFGAVTCLLVSSSRLVHGLGPGRWAPPPAAGAAPSEQRCTGSRWSAFDMSGLTAHPAEPNEGDQGERKLARL